MSAAETGASHLVVGVAGHIDHGKTALVKALTGVDTDRLPEEKARGITIELGFAALTLDDGRRAAVIDMPGHERFVRTMIAGAGGVDLMLLVVAANEGVMPQTREHLAIADLVGVRGGVCALTKCDLASDDLVELAVEEVREVLRGTALDGAPVIPVSAKEGTGLAALRAALTAAAVTPRDASGAPVMPIDRVFARKGFGVVVTGTLVAGTLREGEVVAVGPTGPEHRVLTARVRGLQVHGAAVSEARAGSRVAANLAGVEVAEVPRGQWVFREGVVAVTRSFDARVRLLPETRRALGRRTKLEVAAGATHALATVSLLEGDSLEPGAEALARVSTDRPLVLRVGERLVLRGPPSLAGVGGTVGGLTVVRPMAERVRRRAVALERARRSAAGDARARAEVELEAAGLKGLDADGLMARAGYAASEGRAGVAVGADRWVSGPALEALQAKVLDALSGQHAKHPDERGLDRRALAALGDDAVVDSALGALVAAKRVTREGDVIARAGWRARSADETPYLAQVRAALARAGTSAPSVNELAQSVGTDAKGIALAIKRLVDRGEALKVTSELYVDAAAMGALEAALVQWLKEKGTIDAQGFKELSGLSRKWAIQYLEWFDGRRLTLRVGDRRKLRG